MYDETEATACFDPNNISESAVASATANSATANGNGNGPIIGGVSHDNNNGYSSHEPNTHNNQSQDLDSCLEFQNPNIGNSNTPNHHIMIPNCNLPINDQINNNNLEWVPSNPNPSNNNLLTHNNNNHNEMNLGYTHFDENLQPTTDLLTLLHLPRCSSYGPTTQQQTPISFGKQPSLSFLGELNPAMMVDNPSGSGSSTISYDPATPGSGTAFSYDPTFHLNLPPQPSPLFRDLMFQSLPHHGFNNNNNNNNTGIRGNNNNTGNGNGNSCLFGGLDDGEGNNTTMNGIYQDGDHHHHHHHIHGNGVFEFSKGSDGKAGKCPKNFVTERQRRQNFNDKYQTLKELVPNQTKGDRASIVWDAINHINELRRTVEELKLLVEKKRMAKERMKRPKTEKDSTPSGGPTNGVGVGGGDHHSNSGGGGGGGGDAMKPDPDEEYNGSAAMQLRSSWIQRKCKDTEVDVRIVDDDVTIKLVQRKKINCLLSVSRTLDDLQLDLRHVAGGHVGDYYSYLFNSKICEGSSVYASAIANKLIEVVERQYAAASVAVAPTSSF